MSETTAAKVQHVLRMADFSAPQLDELLRLAITLKQEPLRYRSALERRGIVLLFEKTSTRTSVSFQSAMGRLGGYSIVLDWQRSNFSISPISHEAQYVSRNCDVIMARLTSHSALRELAVNSQVPVINGCDNLEHPTQVLADLMTIMELKGRVDGISITYVGVHNNVTNSLVAASLISGLRLNLITPLMNEAARDDELLRTAAESGRVTWSEDLSSLNASDFVYTDTWVDMENFGRPDYAEEQAARVSAMIGYQLNLTTVTSPTIRVMHDMPIHPAYEISEELVVDPRSVIYQQAENRMYVEMALLLTLLDRGR